MNICRLCVMSTHLIQYSEKYYDDVYEYRHVILPKDMLNLVPKNRLMPEVREICHSVGANLKCK